MSNEPPKASRWQPGKSGNPLGRPKGARSKLTESFLEALQSNFMKHGVETIETVRVEKPDQYLKVIASLVPKDFNLNIGHDAEELSDEQLVDRIRTLTTALTPLLAGGTGGSTDAAGDAPSEGQPSRVH